MNGPSRPSSIHAQRRDQEIVKPRWELLEECGYPRNGQASFLGQTPCNWERSRCSCFRVTAAVVHIQQTRQDPFRLRSARDRPSFRRIPRLMLPIYYRWTKVLWIVKDTLPLICQNIWRNSALTTSAELAEVFLAMGYSSGFLRRSTTN